MPGRVPEGPRHMDQRPLKICGTGVEVPAGQLPALGVA